jgi:hypothetical protein
MKGFPNKAGCAPKIAPPEKIDNVVEIAWTRTLAHRANFFGKNFLE